jgi:L-aspartate oxidase
MKRRGEPHVWLDISHKPSEEILRHFPNIQETLLTHGLDMTSGPIPVVPAAHYSCGGIHTDLNGRTNVSGLNAIGETACTGLHGANRLASTSLLECLTGAKCTAQADIEDIRNMEFRLPEPQPWKSPSHDADPTLIQQDLNLVRQTMWNYAGIVRSSRRLARARRILLELREEVQSFYSDCHLSPELIDLRNAVQTALLIVHAAALNPQSKGCHYVVDDD